MEIVHVISVFGAVAIEFKMEITFVRLGGVDMTYHQGPTIKVQCIPQNKNYMSGLVFSVDFYC